MDSHCERNEKLVLSVEYFTRVNKVLVIYHSYLGVDLIMIVCCVAQVNNAGASGVVVDEERLRALNIDTADWVIELILFNMYIYIRYYHAADRGLLRDRQLAGKVANVVQGVMKHTYEKAEECLNTNYYGVKRVTEALLPLLRLSPSGARIVNVSSLRSELRVSRKTNTSLQNVCD